MTVDIVDMDHVAIRVTDLEAALEFYHELLGLPVRDRDRYEAGEVPYVAVVAGGRHIHLVPTDESSIDPARDEGFSADDEREQSLGETPPLGGDHLCLLVRSAEMETRDQLSELLSEIEAAGYAVKSDEPKKRYGAYGRDWAAYVRDPDGRRVELKIH